MPEKRLYDWDRTLFKTDKFVELIWTFISNGYKVNSEAERARAKNFYTYVGNQYDYDFFAHLRSLGINEDVAKEFSSDAVTELGGSFLYDDVTNEILESIDAIVTWGNDPYQKFKLSMEPRVAHITAHIIQEPKGPYVSRVFGPSVLVDDKDIADEVDPPARFIRLDRAQLEPIIIYPTYVAISSLAHIQAALDERI